nr:GLUG motif-containing protein [uncultured Carboxylicivirga sp.]
MNKLFYFLFILMGILSVQNSTANSIVSHQVRWRADDGDEASATNLEAAQLKEPGTNIRLRIEIWADVYQSEDGPIEDWPLKLQYKQGTSGDWTDVGSTDAHFKSGNSSYLVNGAEGTQQMSSTPFLGAQVYDETSSVSFSSEKSGYFEYEFSIQATDKAQSGVYYFKLEGCSYYDENAVLLYGESLPFDGEGTEENPFLISTLDDLRTLSMSPEYYSYHFSQTADIDASDTQSWNLGNHDNDETTEDQPMGFFPITNFTGTYNGNNHTINGLYINRPTANKVGLFGSVTNGEVSNLGISDAEISGNESVGGLVGNSSNSTVTNCYCAGTITGAGNQVGGLVGYNYRSSITDCYSAGIVNGASDYTGGLVGYNFNSYSISSCYSTCKVTGSGLSTGGLVGYSVNNSIIENCYCTGSVTGSGNSTGGFIGINYSSTIKNCYNTGAVTGEIYTGGFAGQVTAGSVKDCFFNFETSGQITGIGSSNNPEASVTGLTTDEMTGNLCQYTQNSWLFPSEWTMSAADNGGYPALAWQGFAHTASCSLPDRVNGIVIIASIEDLVWLSQSGEADWSADYIQTANIDASTISNFTPIGNNTIKFTGSYDGQGYTISGLTINYPNDNCIGMFGYTAGSVISNLGLTNITVTGTQNVGAIVGQNESNSHITNCYSTGSVTGNASVGGLVGANNGSSYLLNSYSAATVQGSRSIGGIAGWNGDMSEITNCYAIGSVSGISGSEYIGGLVGRNATGSTVNKCYSTGFVSGDSYTGALVGYSYTYDTYHNYIINSYFNSETSGQSNGLGGKSSSSYTTEELTDLSTADMQTLSSFEKLDFAGLTSDGTDDIWAISTGTNNGFPVFMWQIEPTIPALGNVSETTSSSDQDKITITLSGSLTNMGTPNPVQYGFCYSTIETSPTIDNSTIINLGVINGNETASELSNNFSDAITIERGQTVYVRAYAINAVGTGYSSEVKSIISKLTQTISFSTLAPQTYGNADIALKATASSDLTVSYTSSNDEVATIVDGMIHITGAGTCTITASQEGNDTYEAAESVSQELTINKATLTVTADNQTIEQGSEIPVLTFSYSGFVNGEDKSVLDEQPIASTKATTASPADVYPITINGGSDNNYAFEYVNGILTITVVTAIDNVDTNNFKIFPNPASDIIYINGAKGLVTIYSITGKKILTHDLSNSNSINLSNINKGIYILNADGKNVKFIKK